MPTLSWSLVPDRRKQLSTHMPRTHYSRTLAETHTCRKDMAGSCVRQLTNAKLAGRHTVSRLKATRRVSRVADVYSPYVTVAEPAVMRTTRTETLAQSSEMQPSWILPRTRARLMRGRHCHRVRSQRQFEILVEHNSDREG